MQATEWESPAAIISIGYYKHTRPGSFSFSAFLPKADSSLHPQEYTFPSVVKAKLCNDPQTNFTIFIFFSLK